MRGKHVLIFICFLLGIIAVWASTPYWIRLSAQALMKVSPHCLETGEACVRAISIYGSTGDIYGATSSLFSALALFAVAMTLWVDVQARRQLRKPLLVASMDNDSITLDRPAGQGEDPAVLFNASYKVSNQTEDAALNVSVASVLKVGGRVVLRLPEQSIDAPVVKLSITEVKTEHRLAGGELAGVLDALTRENGVVELEVAVNYVSLETVGWTTTVVYELRCNDDMSRRRLNAIRGERGAIDQLWAGNAAVPLVLAVRQGSWKHNQT